MQPSDSGIYGGDSRAVTDGGAAAGSGANAPTRVASALPRVALVISGSYSCFSRLEKQLHAVSMEAVWSRAVHAGATSDIRAADNTLGSTADGGGSHYQACSRDTQVQRTTDGIVRAHRHAWRTIMQEGRAMAVLEEDAQVIGDAAEITAVIQRCEAARRVWDYIHSSRQRLTMPPRHIIESPLHHERS